MATSSRRRTAWPTPSRRRSSPGLWQGSRAISRPGCRRCLPATPARSRARSRCRRPRWRSGWCAPSAAFARRGFPSSCRSEARCRSGWRRCSKRSTAPMRSTFPWWPAPARATRSPPSRTSWPPPSPTCCRTSPRRWASRRSSPSPWLAGRRAARTTASCRWTGRTHRAISLTTDAGMRAWLERQRARLHASFPGHPAAS